VYIKHGMMMNDDTWRMFGVNSL